MNVISIQSQVAYGHVGNSAAVFPMQMHGIDVTAVPTTLLSNRPGYPTIRGRVLDAQLVANLLLGIEERGAVDTAQMILSGYLGSPDIAAVVADFVARAKARNPELLYCCDPVLGTLNMGDDDPRLRWHWLHGLSSEVKGSIDGRLIHDHQGVELEAAFGRLFRLAD